MFVTITNSVTSIGDEAFALCECLFSVTNLATVPQKISEGTFSEYGKFLHVLPGCKAAYEAADYWKNFIIIEDAEDPETTGIADVETKDGNKGGKYLENGKVVIIRNG